MTLAFLALLGAPYIYDISSLRVNATCVSHYVHNVEQFLWDLKELTAYFNTVLSLRMCGVKPPLPDRQSTGMALPLHL